MRCYICISGPGSGNVICGQFAALKTHGRSVDEMIIKEPCLKLRG